MAREYILTVLDTTGIQDYIFGSNRLRENIGASHLVEAATRVWPLKLLRQVGAHNVASVGLLDYVLDDDRRIEDGALDAEVIYAGGGNTLILSAGKSQARKLADLYTHQLIAEAPGLEAALVHFPVDWDDPTGLRAALPQAMKALARKKATRSHSVPVLGLGVSAGCHSTGLPAVAHDPFDLQLGRDEWRYRPIAPAVLAKAGSLGDAKSRLAQLVRPVLDAGFEIPEEFDEFGPEEEAGEGSYIAVVHADGNNMSCRFEKAANTAAGNREAVLAVRRLSQLVDRAGQEALYQLAVKLVTACNATFTELAGEMPLGRYMPFRPLVFGGDDVTFVCDGRLGLALATAYLEAFEEAFKEAAKELIPAGPDMEPAYACAGVAVVKTHYPFARAYSLAEDLCRKAKAYVRETAPSPEKSFSALDWHFASGGLYGDVDAIRKREYEVAAGHLAMRPIRLRDAGDDWRTWPRFARVVREFQAGDEWKDKHNKVVRLRDALRQGRDAVVQYLAAYDLKLPELSAQISDLQSKGWYGGTCGYFDAVEAAKFYVPLS